jgi:hypothetical protein
VNGWVTPAPGSELRAAPFDLLRGFYPELGPDDLFVVEEMRYFTAPSPRLDGAVAEFWFIEAHQEHDPGFRARWLVWRHDDQIEMLAVAPVPNPILWWWEYIDHEWVEYALGPGWTVFLDDGFGPHSYPGLPGTYTGTPYGAFWSLRSVAEFSPHSVMLQFAPREMWQPIISPVGADALGCLPGPDGVWWNGDQHYGWPDRWGISMRSRSARRTGGSIHLTVEVTMDNDAEVPIERAFVIASLGDHHLYSEGTRGGIEHMAGFTDPEGTLRFTVEARDEEELWFCVVPIHHPEFWTTMPHPDPCTRVLDD